MNKRYIRVYQENDPTFRVLDEVIEYDKSKYHMVFEGYVDILSLPGVDKNHLTDKSILEGLFEMFNREQKPYGYKGHSLSVGDIVMLTPHGDLVGRSEDTYICANMGWNKILFKQGVKND